ncbi:4-hydroxythreonine-4-phosphate dehydrogenase [Marinobacterium lacunae]|uniref:4-hydroxythreonine-4-phosphate dehydrogenase n=1 Tax=Marinobacterium lacunae TaxID=1232683 RepID=A0A081FZJ9_9GAMM|nr:4-hydroxythreonine-4-phosphate dehydrogenase PdxA [Marinobacterium lacunae]KEA63954.1 4-hydroxythreonine-4-phosphate dehydrogenase [Marinobacterium lacunae]
MVNDKPTVALTLGDPAGIGSELIAKLLSHRQVLEQANVVLVGDEWLWQRGQTIAGVQVELQPIVSLAEARAQAGGRPLFLAVDSVHPEEVEVGTARASGGASVLKVLDLCLAAVRDRQIDAICFAPLNKHAMKQAGMPFEDELHYFADYLNVDGFFCEFNTLGGLWTSRISSHVPLKDVPLYLEKGRIKQASQLIYRSLQAAGVAEPRVAVAALNPHGGDGGVCGREEIDIIAPAVEELNAEGVPVHGPFPADTIFLKARAGEYDAIVTMYHDQGQIAIKLLGFERGVTVQGGLPVPITTPAHGTAYDIAGQNRANVEATLQAFHIACRMGAAYRAEANC